MSQISPFIISAVQASGVQRMASEEKDSQLRQAQEVRENAGHAADRFEHAVESAEAMDPLHDEAKKDSEQKKKQHKEDPSEEEPLGDDSHLDLKA